MFYMFIWICLYIYVYQSEGAPERLLWIPGCVEEWASAGEKSLCVCLCVFLPPAGWSGGWVASDPPCRLTWRPT